MREHEWFTGPSEELRGALRQRLGEHNVAVSVEFARGVTGELDVPVPLEAYLRDGEVLLAGVAGFTRRGWLDVEFLWVDASLRGRGFGARLLDYVEGVALQRGVRRAKLTTFDFQAPEFYLSRGYVVYGRLDDYPVGCTLYLLSKQLA